MKKINNYLKTGMLFLSATFLLDAIFDLPEFIKGFFVGISLVFEIIGIYAINHDISKFKNFKRKLFKLKGEN